jgi:hypothetical protein
MESNTMSKRKIPNSKRLAARPEDSEIENARELVTSLLKMAIERRKADLEVLRELSSQTSTTSPFLLAEFSSAADGRVYSDLGRKFVSEGFGFVDYESGTVLPKHGDYETVQLDAFLHHYVTEAEWRRRQERERRPLD